LVFAAWDNYTEQRINDVFSNMNKERGLPDTGTEDYKNNLIKAYVNRPAEVNFEHAARQAYIGFGFAIAEAALLQVDATPMEGFDNAKIDELLNLSHHGLKSVTLLPLGYRDETGDWLVNLKKVRQPNSSFIIEHQ
jgi:nitroreductase